MICPDCKQGRIDSSDGTSVCTNCGYVVGESEIVNDVTFGETATGAATVHGTQVSGATGKHSISGPGGRKYGDGDSRAMTIHQAQQSIRNILGRLGIDSPSLTQTSVRIFTLALNIGQGQASFWNEHLEEPDKGGNLVQGRKSDYSYGACIYVACRRMNQPIMLIEIADQINVNVFVLGRAYLRLAQLLRYDPEQKNLITMDPSLYIRRFAKLLDFGDETERVVEDASRLCTRFKKDWLAAGRRPSGITGACLLIAARMNNFRRSVAEIVQVVKVADVTLKKRLDEFKSLPASEWSIEQFRSRFDQDYEANEMKKQPVIPPSSLVNQEKEAELRREKARRAADAKLRSIDRLRRKEAAAAEQAKRAVAGLDPKGSDEEESSESEDDEEEEEDEGDAADENEDEQQNGSTPARGKADDSPEKQAYREHVEEQMSTMLTQEVEGFLASSELKADMEKATREQEESEVRAKMTHAQRLERKGGQASAESSTGQDVAANAGSAADGTPTPAQSNALGKRRREDEASATTSSAAKPVKKVKKKKSKGKVKAKLRNADEIEGDPLAGLDEDELDGYLLTREEQEVKERIWTEFNKQWLEESLQKALKEEEDLRRGIQPRKYKKRQKNNEKNIVRDSSNAAGASAIESTAKLLKTKKLSKKINYAALGNLFPGQGSEYGGGVGGASGSRSRRSDADDDDERDAPRQRRRRATSEATSEGGVGAALGAIPRSASRARSDTVGGDSDYISEGESQHSRTPAPPPSEGWDDAYED